MVDILAEGGSLYALSSLADGLVVAKLDTSGNLIWALRGHQLVPTGLGLSPEEILVAGYLDRDGETDFLFFSVSKDGLQHPVCLAETTFSTVDTLLSLSEDSLPELDLSLDLVPSGYGCAVTPVELVPYDPCILPGCAETPREGGLRVEGAKGSLLVWAPEPALLEVYEPSGRLLLSKRVPRGLGRIRLKRGVYLWRAGPRSGSALVR